MTITITLSDGTVREIIALWKRRKLHFALQELIYKDLQSHFAAAIKKVGDPCPFCGAATEEDSFASSYGSPNSSTWTIDWFCYSCDIRVRKMTSTTNHK